MLISLVQSSSLIFCYDSCFLFSAGVRKCDITGFVKMDLFLNVLYNMKRENFGN